jgi:hypothetical protein
MFRIAEERQESREVPAYSPPSIRTLLAEPDDSTVRLTVIRPEGI